MASEPLLLPSNTSSDTLQQTPIAEISAKRPKRQLTERQIASLRANAFKPGQSGNPGGRPCKPLTDKLHSKLLAQRGRLAGQIADGIIEKAKSGDVAAFVAIADRVEGKPVQRVEGDQAIHITVERIGD